MKTKIKYEVASRQTSTGYKWKLITPEDYAIVAMSGDFTILRRVEVHWCKPDREIDRVVGSIKFPDMWFYPLSDLSKSVKGSWEGNE